MTVMCNPFFFKCENLKIFGGLHDGFAQNCRVILGLYDGFYNHRVILFFFFFEMLPDYTIVAIKLSGNPADYTTV